MTAIVLLISGMVHLGLLVLQGGSWEGPLSLRKPALFGISGGLTVWSMVWLATKLQPKRLDGWLLGSMALALLFEVGLITMQYWRGVGSHFNHTTWLDSAIELAMLGLILIVTAEIGYLTWRSYWLRPVEPSMVLAIRGGLWLLTISCGLGIATSVLGTWSLTQGESYEVWGKAGVLKFPHGVALHAIQWLPILAWLAKFLEVSQPLRMVRAALAAQCLFLVYALWQTGHGRSRWDFDWVGACLLATTLILVAYPIFAFSRRFAQILFARQRSLSQ